MLIRALERLALTVMAGALWSVGYLVGPLLFRTLDDPGQAAAVSGELTGVAAWVCLGCAAVLVPAQLRRRVRPLAAHWRLWLVILLTALVAVGEHTVRPATEALAAMPQEADHIAALRAAESLYFVASAMALVLVLGGMRPQAAAEAP